MHLSCLLLVLQGTVRNTAGAKKVHKAELMTKQIVFNAGEGSLASGTDNPLR
jgi:hypothetical protein